MKKTLMVAALLVFGFSFQALAANNNSQSQGNGKSSVATQDKKTKTVAAEQNKTADQGEDAQTQEQDGVKTNDKTKDKNKENKGQINAESHRSAVATFVQSLLTVADKEGGIGEEVKVIAQQQNETKDRTSDLINAVENRSKVKTFFIGTSYKNLGELRSQMVQTRNQIEQLKRLAEKAQNEEDKTELQTQIQALEQEQTNINNFITQNESKFSLFGWAVKLFRK